MLLVWVFVLFSITIDARLRLQETKLIEDLRHVHDKSQIPLTSPVGRVLFAELLSMELRDTSKGVSVLGLLQYLETQMNLGACAAASAVTVLNALDFNSPHDPTYSMFGQGYAFWTQSSYAYHECVKNTVGGQVFGETLDQLGTIMKCIGLQVECHHGDKSESFLAKFKSHLEKHHVVIANFDRSGIHQVSGGHFSPVFGLTEQDKTLILDVARYKYPPTFVSIQDLVNAMSTYDLQSQKNRGYCALKAAHPNSTAW